MRDSSVDGLPNISTKVQLPKARILSAGPGYYSTGWFPVAPGAPYTGSRIMGISITSQEATLLTAFRRLTPDAAGELTRLIEGLSAVAPERKIDWSDSWSDEDLKEFRATSLRRLDENEAEEAG